MHFFPCAAAVSFSCFLNPCTKIPLMGMCFAL
jgi:hypothetical protein